MATAPIAATDAKMPMFSHISHALVIAAVLLVSYSYFPDLQGGANQDSRFGLTRALAENHRFYIEGYDNATIDRVFWNGHFYSDKAPGLALSAVPVWASSRILLQGHFSEKYRLWAERSAVTVACVAFPAAIAAACVFLIAMKLGASVSGAGFAAVTLGLGTPFWCYSTLFWGHAVTASFLVFALAAVVCLRKFDSDRRDLSLSIFLGLVAGWAIVTEFPAAPAAAILISLALSYAWSDGHPRLLRVATGVAVGALPCILVLCAYNSIAFGFFFKLGYTLSAQQGWPQMSQGLLGVTYPKPYALREILLGHYRGLLSLAPIIAVAPIGIWLLVKQAEARAFVLTLTAIALYYILLNASYSVWDGGWSFGPRHLSPALPFLCVPLALLWTRSPVVVRWLLGVGACYGIFISLLAVSTNKMPPSDVTSPVHDLLWPTFRSGELSHNLGTSAGLHGLSSLIPLFLVWGVGFLTWLWLKPAGIAEPSVIDSGRL